MNSFDDEFCWLQLKLHYWDNESATKDEQVAHGDGTLKRTMDRRCRSLLLSLCSCPPGLLWWNDTQLQNRGAPKPWNSVSHKEAYISLTSALIVRLISRYWSVYISWLSRVSWSLPHLVGSWSRARDCHGASAPSSSTRGGMAGWRAGCSVLSSRVQSLISSGSRVRAEWTRTILLRRCWSQVSISYYYPAR